MAQAVCGISCYKFGKNTARDADNETSIETRQGATSPSELPGRKKHASVYFTVNLCCQNVFPAIIIGKSRCENKTVGQE